MCDTCNTATDAPVGYIGGGQMETKSAHLKESTLRDRLESRRNRLTQQLAQVEAALQLIYTNPDAEKIHDVLNRSGI
jgi:hypothetical protein